MSGINCHVLPNVCRGENRLAGWEYRPVANCANRCLLRMIVSTDIKVSRLHLSQSTVSRP